MKMKILVLCLGMIGIILNVNSFAQKAKQSTCLKIINGRPVLVKDSTFLTAIYCETFKTSYHKTHEQMLKAGVQVLMLNSYGHLWRNDNVYGDESDLENKELSLDQQVSEALAINPNAYFMVRFNADIPDKWAKKHPDHLQASDKRTLDKPSYASRLAAEGKAESARHLIKYVESRPWSNRVLGYLTFGDEGTSHHAIEDGPFDQSGVSKLEFAKYVKEKYSTEENLRKAWNNPNVSFSTLQVPTNEEWVEAKKSWKHWPEPHAQKRYHDYFECYSKMLEFQQESLLSAIQQSASQSSFNAMDALKQPMFGWLIVDAFNGSNLGMEYQNILLGSGSIGVGRILDNPAINALVTPADYTARSCGFGWEPEGIGDAMVLRGKTILIEDDARSWAATYEKGTQGAWRNEQECRAGLMRNLAISASRGFIPYWMNVGAGNGYFNDPVVMKVIKEQVPVRQELLTMPLKPTEHAIAMIIDDQSPLEEDFTAGFQNLSVLRQRTDHLALTGLPYRIYLFDDIKLDNFPKFRTYIFPNLFKLTPEKIALIREKLMRDGSVLIFGPGTGITDGETLSAKGASELLGFPLEMVDKEVSRRVLVYGGQHRALQDISGPEVYGDSYSYGPLLQPGDELDKSGAVELGKATSWWNNNTAGLVMKEFGKGAAGNGKPGQRGAGDYAVVFSMSVPIPANVLRSLALYGGCNPWSDLGDVVAANGNMVAVHSVKAGKRTIHLPKKHTVIDAVSNKVIATQSASFTIAMQSPDTQVFILK